MKTMISPIRPGLAAIAAVLALSSTTLMAQDAVPSTPPPATDPLSPTTAPEPTPEPAIDPLAASEATTVTTATTATTRSAAKPAPVRRAASRTAAASSAPRVAPAAPVEAAPASLEPVVAPTLAAPAAIEPAAPVPAPSESLLSDDALPIAGAAALGLLALAAAGMAASRRRRRDQAMGVAEWHEPAMARAAAPPPPAATRMPPAVAPAVAPTFAPASAPASAFSWGAAPARRDDPIAAAYRGPSADNPSLSLKKRLKRASFFAQHEHAVAKGKAKPLARTAGLPAALARAGRGLRDTVTPQGGVSFNRTYQPA